MNFTNVLHSAKVTVWCEVNSHDITGPYFFENEKGCTVTMNAERYKVMLETFLYIELHSRQQICYGYNKMAQLFTQQKFPCKSSEQYFLAVTFLIKGQHLAARSPGHAVPYYFVWGYVKSKVYGTLAANIADLKQRILECIQGIPKEMLQCIMTAFTSRLQECIERHSLHLQSFIFRQ